MVVGPGPATLKGVTDAATYSPDDTDVTVIEHSSAPHELKLTFACIKVRLDEHAVGYAPCCWHLETVTSTA